MYPTLKLRFSTVSVFKDTPRSQDEYGNGYVLQQWWESNTIPNTGEWRNIPTEIERGKID